jgi:hypothetical protein
MNRSEGRGEDVRQARMELIKALHRKSLLEREEADLAALRPRLPDDIDAAWDAPRKSR